MSNTGKASVGSSSRPGGAYVRFVFTLTLFSHSNSAHILAAKATSGNAGATVNQASPQSAGWRLGRYSLAELGVAASRRVDVVHDVNVDVVEVDVRLLGRARAEVADGAVDVGTLGG